MMRKLFILPALLVAMLLVFGCQQSSTTTSPTTIVVGNEVGNLAPDFQLQDLEGNTFILSSLKGSPVIINFWRST
jgi:cytochrome oxidase Cu insertion factor (SCO1/SenC/PrrC family)